jgi:hypothetical protein
LPFKCNLQRYTAAHKLNHSGGFNRVREHQSIALSAGFDWETHRLDLGAVTVGICRLNQVYP